MKAKIQNTVTREINVDVPSWWKTPGKDTETFYKITSETQFTQITITTNKFYSTGYNANFPVSSLKFIELDPSTEEEYENAKAIFIETISK